MRKISIVLLWAAAFVLAVGGPSFSEVVERILAIVNDVPITMSEFDDYKFIVASLPYQAPPAWLDEGATLEDYIDYQLTHQDAQRSGLAIVSKGEVDQAVNRMRRAIRDKGGLEEVLKRRGLSLEDLADFVKGFIGALKYVEIRFRPLASPSEDEVAAYMQMTFTDPSGLSPGQKDAAKREAEKIKFKKIYYEYINALKNRATIHINEP